MTKKEFIESLKEHENYFYTNDLLSSSFIGGTCMGKRRSPQEPIQERGSILIINERWSGGSYKLKPYGWYGKLPRFSDNLKLLNLNCLSYEKIKIYGSPDC